MSEPVTYTQEELETRCKLWQERLRLQDWIVKVKVVPHFQIVSPSSQGEIAMCLSRKDALIRVLDPEHYEPNKSFPQDMEEALVHELVHLHFVPLGISNDDPRDVSQEQAVQSIASSLVKAYRRIEELEQLPIPALTKDASNE